LSEHDKSGSDWEKLSPEQGTTGAQDYRVELPVFEGPLDLLLHLIRKHEIDIFDIPVSIILEKYLAYIKWMEVLNLDIAGEFLVMAATLTHIKSRMLLPPGEGEEEEEEEEGDPREELVRRLLEYERYKDAADELRDRPILNRDVFSRTTKFETEDEEQSPFAEVSVFKLIEVLDKVMQRARQRISHEVLVERISIADRIQELSEVLKGQVEVTFERLFDEQLTRPMVIITFIALLEMARLRMIRLHQVQSEQSDVLYVRSLLDEVNMDEVLEAVREDEEHSG